MNHKVRLRRFGRFGFDVSEIGFGTWGIGGRTAGETSYGPTDDKASNLALNRAVELGTNFFDTAAAYGDGHSETLLGHLAARASTPLVISTKAGIPIFGGPADFSPKALETSLKGSKARLRTTALTGLLLHNPSPALIEGTPEITEFLEQLYRSEDIAFWGLSVKSPADALAVLNKRDVPVVQVNLNMLDIRAITSGLLTLAAARGTAIIARTPLCFGFLSGKVDENTKFPDGDHRNAWSHAQKQVWATGAKRAWSLAKPGADESMSQTAIRFCLSFPAVSVVLPGPLTEHEVIENAGASARGPLSASAIDAIIEMNQNTDFFVRA